MGVKFQTYTQRVRASGGKLRDPNRKAANVNFDISLFNRLADRAHKKSISLSELIRTYCEWGLSEEMREYNGR